MMVVRMVGGKVRHSVAGKAVQKVDQMGTHLAEHLVEH